MNQENQRLLQRIRKQENKRNVMSLNNKQLQDLIENSQRQKIKQAEQIDRQNMEMLKRISSQKSITNNVFEKQLRVKQKCDRRFVKNLEQQVTPNYRELINKSQQDRLQEQRSVSKICANEGSMSPLMILESMSSGFDNSTKRNTKKNSDEKKDFNFPQIQHDEVMIQDDSDFGRSRKHGSDFVMKK